MMRKVFRNILAPLTVAALLCAPCPALAADTAADKELAAATARLQESSERERAARGAYEEAESALEAAKEEASAASAALTEAEERLASQSDATAAAIRADYKLKCSPGGALSIVLGCTDVEEMTSTARALLELAGMLGERLDSAAADVEAARAASEAADEAAEELSERDADAKAALEEAEAALQDAQRLRDEAQRRAEEERARQEADEAAALAAQQARERSASLPAVDGVDWSMTRGEFVSHWTARIDRYLAGSPLAGHGSTFAEAAWDCGVDPRWSPAISNTESTKGRYCFRPHNAWGWGSVSWPDWDTAIRAHVAGLASGYGATITPAAAKKYCPPTWEHWYTVTCAEMAKI